MGKREQVKKGKKLNNVGFTLIEVVVSLAIMVVVAAAVSTFVVSGNQTYMRGNNSVTIQEEVQLSVNQIIDLIIDVEKKLDYTVTADGTAELRIYNNDSTYMLRWVPDDGSGASNANQVHLYETGAVTTGVAFDPVTSYTGYLLAEYVTSFQVDLSKVKDSIVVLNMSFQYMDETYQISETIKLRNRLGALEESALVWIDTIQVVPDTHSMKRGTSFDFDCVMTGDDEAVAQGAIWKVERVDGNSISSGTYIDGSGKLMVDSGEAVGASALLITATSVADSTKSATASVTVEADPKPFDPHDVSLIVRTLTTEEYGPLWNRQQQYVAIIECLPDYSDYENGYPKIVWSETSNPTRYNISEESQFTAKLECGTMQDTIATVRAEVEISAGVFVEKSIDIYIPKLHVVEDNNKPYIDSDNFVLNRNGSVHLELKNYKEWLYGEVTWRISDTLGLGSTDPNARLVGFDLLEGTFDEVNNTSNYTDTHVGMTADVRAKLNIDFNKEYRLNVQAVRSNGDVVAETTVLIPRFEILFAGGEHYKTIAKPVWYSHYYLEVYGFNIGRVDGAGGNHRLSLQGSLEAENPMASGTRIADINFNNNGDYVAMDVAWDEANEYLVLILWDERRPEAKRSLMFIVQ